MTGNQQVGAEKKKRGRPKTGRRGRLFTCRIDDVLFARLEAFRAAQPLDVSRTAVLEAALAAYLDKARC